MGHLLVLVVARRGNPDLNLRVIARQRILVHLREILLAHLPLLVLGAEQRALPYNILINGSNSWRLELVLLIDDAASIKVFLAQLPRLAGPILSAMIFQVESDSQIVVNRSIWNWTCVPVIILVVASGERQG